MAVQQQHARWTRNKTKCASNFPAFTSAEKLNSHSQENVCFFLRYDWALFFLFVYNSLARWNMTRKKSAHGKRQNTQMMDLFTSQLWHSSFTNDKYSLLLQFDGCFDFKYLYLNHTHIYKCALYQVQWCDAGKKTLRFSINSRMWWEKQPTDLTNGKTQNTNTHTHSLCVVYTEVFFSSLNEITACRFRISFVCQRKENLFDLAKSWCEIWDGISVLVFVKLNIIILD